MVKTHDTFRDLHLGTPSWFTFCARLLPMGLLGQFLSAGIALFHNNHLWGFHAALGWFLLVPITMLFGGTIFVRWLRGFGWWAGLLFLLYLAQVALAASEMLLLLSLHPLNGAILLATSGVFLLKVERRRAAAVRKSGSDHEAPWPRPAT